MGQAIKTDMIATSYIVTDETVTVVDSAVDGLPADVSDVYQIFFVANEMVFGGDFSTGAGASPETRPTDIESSDGIGRKP